MVATEARNTATNTVPAAMSLELVAPAACSSSGSFDPVPAGAIAAAEASSMGADGDPVVPGSAAAGVPDDGSVAGVVAAGVVADGGEVPATGGVEPSPAASAASQEKWQACEAAGELYRERLVWCLCEDHAQRTYRRMGWAGRRRWGSWTAPGRGRARWGWARAWTRRRGTAPGPGGSPGAGSSRRRASPSRRRRRSRCTATG